MPSAENIKRVYTPDDLAVMANAYDKAQQRLPKEWRGNERAARKLALIIIHAVDRGEHDPEQLTDLATLAFLR